MLKLHDEETQMRRGQKNMRQMPRPGRKSRMVSRLIFRNENALGVGTTQYTPENHWTQRRPPTRFNIKDITAEIIQDYQSYDPTESEEPHSQNRPDPLSPTSDKPGLQQSGDQLEAKTHEFSISLDTPRPLETILDSPSTRWSFDDSAFHPGFAYLDAHFTLRNCLMHEVQSTENIH